MRRIFPLIFFVVAATYGFFRPELFSFNEQYQFFQFGCDYLLEHLAIPSEMSGYVAEFFVQFFIIPILGSAVLAGLWTAMGLLIRNLAEKYCGHQVNTALSFLPVAAVAIYFCDEFVMLAFPMSLIISLLLISAYIRIKFHKRYLLQLILIPIVYWITGYGAWLYIGVTLLFDVRSNDMKRAAIQGVGMVAYLVMFVMIMANTALQHFPYPHLFLGYNFYRWPLQWPWGQHFCTVLVLASVALVGKLREFRYSEYVSPAITVIVLLVGCHTNYDHTRSILLRMDYWVRFQRWEDIIAFAEKNPVNNEMAISATNLALAQKGLLSARYNQFPQMGIEGMVSSFKFNMVFNAITAEVCYYLGFVDQALRFNYDSQAAISNKNLSARFSRRIAETYMLNGNYDAARMYTAPLKRTIFYSAFARKLEDCMEHPERINETARWKTIQESRIYNGDYYFCPTSFPYLLSEICKKGSGNSIAYQYYILLSNLSN